MSNIISETFSGLVSYFNDFIESISDKQTVGNYSMAEIGKPFYFTDFVDPNQRTYKFLATRMNMIDIYPVNYGQIHFYSDTKKKSLFKYGLGYEVAMQRYRKMCSEYLGMTNPPSALRIFLTDDTTVTDGIASQYGTNFFQASADKMSSRLQNFISPLTSMSSQGSQRAVDKLLMENIDTNKITADIADVFSISNPKAKNLLGGFIDGLKKGASIVLKGHRISLPKIWQSSTYTSTFNISTKLFSPYGSPKAIKEYIIKPLTMILLMGTPQSDDMTSYNRPFPVTVRSWGNSFLSLAGITSITLQRGGTDSVYNIYKQPLTININIEFTSLVDGVMAFSSLSDDLKIPEYERTSYLTSDKILSLDSSAQSIDGSVLPTVTPTVGGIIRSMQPVQLADLTVGYGPYKSTRDDVMIGGNGLGSSSGLLGNNSGGILSGFNAAYEYAKNNATSQANFGELLLNGITTAIGGVASGIITVGNSVNNTLNSATLLANILTSGAFANTKLAKDIAKFQSDMNQNNRDLNTVVIGANRVKDNILLTQKIFGSLLSFPVE